MKYTTIKALEKHLAESAPLPIYLILGKEAFERKQAVDLLISKLLKKEDNPELSCKILDGDRLDIEELMQELNTFGFFAKFRIVLIQNADKLSKPITEELESYFANPNPTICLILSAITINHATNFYKKGEKVGISLEFLEEKPWEKEKTMKDWVNTLALAEGKTIDQQAVQVLLKQIGTDQALIQQEMEKLFCYVGDKQQISLQDISAVCTHVNVETAWQLGEAIFKRDAPNALRISKALLSDGVAVFALIRQIRSQLQTEYQISTLLAQGTNTDQISRKFPYMRGQILERHLQMAQQYGTARFKKAMLKIDEIELLAKNSSTDPEVLTELLIIKLVT
jgi:DNA polymerase-3 subunit delta